MQKSCVYRQKRKRTVYNMPQVSFRLVLGPMKTQKEPPAHTRTHSFSLELLIRTRCFDSMICAPQSKHAVGVTTQILSQTTMRTHTCLHPYELTMMTELFTVATITFILREGLGCVECESLSHFLFYI